ncbi:phosphodiesterase [Trichonephila clavipes]|nr:phosphodiesterase [Trichonephila clavipes]
MDYRFNSRIDQTGYATHNMLCMPILDVDGEVKGVAQIINKCGGEEPFTDADEKGKEKLHNRVVMTGGSVDEQRTKREGVHTESVHNVMPSAGR